MSINFLSGGLIPSFFILYTVNTIKVEARPPLLLFKTRVEALPPHGVTIIVIA